MPRDNKINSVLIIGSGPIIIGQACEFDYSGSQASRSLREEGIEVTLINSNPATIMTDEVTANNIYLKPLVKQSIIEILEKHDIDAVLPTMGGQTALNLAIECENAKIWKKYKVKMIGVNVDAIAEANLIVKSTVIGYSPTLPLIPSVPNILLFSFIIHLSN